MFPAIFFAAGAAITALFLSGCDDETENTPPPLEPECPPAPEVVTENLPVTNDRVVDFFSPHFDQACLGISDPDCLAAAQRLEDIFTETLESTLPSGMTRADFEQGNVSYSLFREFKGLKIIFGQNEFEFKSDINENSFNQNECPGFQLEPLAKKALYLESVWYSPYELDEGNVFPWDDRLFFLMDAVQILSRRSTDCKFSNHVLENGTPIYASLSHYLAQPDGSNSQHYALGLHNLPLVFPCEDLNNPILNDGSQNYDCDVTDTCGQGEAIANFQSNADNQVLLLEDIKENIVYKYEPNP